MREVCWAGTGFAGGLVGAGEKRPRGKEGSWAAHGRELGRRCWAGVRKEKRPGWVGEKREGGAVWATRLGLGFLFSFSFSISFAFLFLINSSLFEYAFKQIKLCTSMNATTSLNLEKF